MSGACVCVASVPSGVTTRSRPCSRARRIATKVCCVLAVLICSGSFHAAAIVCFHSFSFSGVMVFGMKDYPLRNTLESIACCQRATHCSIFSAVGTSASRKHFFELSPKASPGVATIPVACASASQYSSPLA